MALAQPSQTPLGIALKEGAPALSGEQLQGRWTVLHFLPEEPAENTVRSIQEVRRQAPTLAGVRQVFLFPEKREAGALRARLVPELTGLDDIFIEAGPGLAERMEVVARPAVAIVSPQGEVVYKHAARQAEAYLPFRSIAAQVERRWRDPQLDRMNLQNGVALGGYDPVAYFVEGEAKQGKAALRSSYLGATYYFSTPEHQAAFAKEPEKYLPAFGGWDAAAMADGERVAPDPVNFRISQGRLLLFYKGIWGDGREAWTREEPALLRRAADQWEQTAAAQRGIK